jgi:hypothetical protein
MNATIVAIRQLIMVGVLSSKPERKSPIVPLELIYTYGFAFPIIGVTRLSGEDNLSSDVLVIEIPKLRIVLACNYHPQTRDHLRVVDQNAATRKRTLVTERSGRHVNVQTCSLMLIYVEQWTEMSQVMTFKWIIAIEIKENSSKTLWELGMAFHLKIHWQLFLKSQNKLLEWKWGGSRKCKIKQF